MSRPVEDCDLPPGRPGLRKVGRDVRRHRSSQHRLRLPQDRRDDAAAFVVNRVGTLRNMAPFAT